MNSLVDVLPEFGKALLETFPLVLISLAIGGLVGFVIGIILYTTRPGSLYQNRFWHGLLNVIVNFFRPIPFVIFLAAVAPISRIIIGTGSGMPGAIFAISLAASFAIGRIVEQNLLTVSPGVVEAARASGASLQRTLWTIVVPEALGPLVLGYTFVFVAIVDMSALAGLIGGGGIGDFAIRYGMQQFRMDVVWAALLVLILIVQLVQFAGNSLGRKLLRR